MHAAALTLMPVVLAHGHGGGLAGPAVPPADLVDRGKDLPRARVLRPVVAGETVYGADRA